MEYKRRLFISIVAWVGMTSLAAGQMMRQGPSIPGILNPVVGGGAEYEVTQNGEGKSTWSYAVVGKEKFQGAEGYWLEMRMQGGPQGGTIMKMLTVVQGGKAEAKRMIIQSSGQPAMEMPMEMMAGAQKAVPTDPKALGEKVGSEMVTVPAGAFLCDHYQRQTDSATTDVWISPKVPPNGLVKMNSPDQTMTLVKVLANQTSQIKGEVMSMGPGLP